MKMNKNSLEGTIRSLLIEQKTYAKAQWEKEKKPSIDIGGHPHDPSGPNKSHIEEEQLDEIPVNVPIGKNRRKTKKTSFAFNSLGGKALSSRASAQRQGNQSKNRYENFSYFAEEATKKVMKKLSEKDSKKDLGKTDTGKPSDIIDTEPTKTELTGPTR
jgi:hypothetical protein